MKGDGNPSQAQSCEAEAEAEAEGRRIVTNVCTTKSSDTAFYARFKPIRNSLRRYSPLSVLKGCLDHLYEPAPDRISRVSRMPWIHLLLVKWAFLDEQAKRSGRPAIPKDSLHKLLQDVYELSDNARLPTDYEHVNLFMRATAYQQFPFQIPLNFDGLARQELLFARVDRGHFFQNCFIEKLGIPVGDFLRLALYLLGVLQTSTSYVVSRRWFSVLERHYSRQIIDRFLASISINIEDLSDTLKKSEEKERTALEYLQQSPFISYPLLRVGEDYWCVYPEVLQQCLDHFAFDFLKEADPQRFNTTFRSKRFETYIKDILSHSGLTFATEHDLEKILPETGKLVDFLVNDGDANIFIDAKAVEMAPRGKVAHLREVVKGATNSSLIKALQQGQTVCSRVSNFEGDHPVIKPRKHNYLLAITYKDLYISNGISLNAAIGDEAMKRIQSSEIGDAPPIPLENVYFLSIDEFEELLALIKAGRIGLAEALDRAKLADSNPADRKFIFTMHLRSWPEWNGITSPLLETSQSLLDDVKAALEKSAKNKGLE